MLRMCLYCRLEAFSIHLKTAILTSELNLICHHYHVPDRVALILLTVRHSWDSVLSLPVSQMQFSIVILAKSRANLDQNLKKKISFGTGAYLVDFSSNKFLFKFSFEGFMLIQTTVFYPSQGQQYTYLATHFLLSLTLLISQDGMNSPNICDWHWVIGL